MLPLSPGETRIYTKWDKSTIADYADDRLIIQSVLVERLTDNYCSIATEWDGAFAQLRDPRRVLQLIERLNYFSEYIREKNKAGAAAILWQMIVWLGDD